MSVLDVLDREDRTAVALAEQTYADALASGTVESLPPDRLRELLAALGLNRNDVRNDLRALQALPALQAEDPADDALADAVQVRDEATTRVRDLPMQQQLEREKANRALDAASQRYFRLKEKRRIVRQQIADLKRANPRAFP